MVEPKQSDGTEHQKAKAELLGSGSDDGSDHIEKAADAVSDGAGEEEEFQDCYEDEVAFAKQVEVDNKDGVTKSDSEDEKNQDQNQDVDQDAES